LSEPGQRKIVVPENIRGLIFDCDGTLVDSMPLHMKAWEHVLSQAVALWDYEFFYSKKGMPERKIVELYNTSFGSGLNPEETVRQKHLFMSKYQREYTPIPPVVDIVLRYHNVLPMAVASGSTREIVSAELDAIGIRHLFHTILTADDGIIPTPAPDLFFQTSLRMNVPPSECQIFEDGELGLFAAQTAGMLAPDVRDFI
jgi:beta-phosphoglucomutase-like phosphatase (HAD superfamily)